MELFIALWEAHGRCGMTGDDIGDAFPFALAWLFAQDVYFEQPPCRMPTHNQNQFGIHRFDLMESPGPAFFDL